MLNALGDAESVKLGAVVTVSVTEVVAVRLPDVPVTVIVVVPGVAALLAVSVKLLDVLALVGLKEAVTPLGKPDAVQLTLPLKPFWGVMLIVLAPEAPCTIVRLLGELDKVKLGAAGAPIETLSKVAVAKFPVFPLVAASPMYTFWPMLMV